MDEAYGILEYNSANLFNYISYKTKTSYTDISQKKQIIYLTNYLDHHKGENSVFFIYESEYIDQHYLDDYSSYYSKSFYPYDKTCARVHFFKTKISIDSKTLNSELKDALNNQDSIIKNEDYLGFIVIRPIPNTFLAKVCIKPSRNNNGNTKRIISKLYNVSLFGIPLSVRTIAFQEQEKILSACATTALWSFFHAHQSMNFDNLPSGYSITKSAYSENGGHDSEFPNKGLSTDMICRSMKKYGLFPKSLNLSKNKSMYLREYLYAYNTHEIPAIYGVKVKEKDEGLHAVTVLGYTLNDVDSSSSSLDSIPLCADNIKHIHAHDDRNGAFLRVNLASNIVEIDGDKDTETYEPDTLILGIDKSIRIEYQTVKDFCQKFRVKLSDALDIQFFQWKTKREDFMSLMWDIRLKKVNELKESIVGSTISDKISYLTKSWPKYIWSATLKDDKNYFELLFDATNIEQGKIFLGILYFDDYANTLGKDIEMYFDELYGRYKKEHLFDEVQQFILKKDTYPEILTKDFGTLCMPEEIKTTELVGTEIIEKQLVIINNSVLNKHSMDDLCKDGYDLIWLIDMNGSLIIGREKKGSHQGHPTLTGGNPGRIAGEIQKKDDKWEVNPFSRRYSQEYTKQEKMKYLENVITYKLKPTFPNDVFEISDFN